MCDVCNNQSCTRDIGVAAIPTAPMSIMWGDKCLAHRPICVPDFVFDYWLSDIGADNLSPECSTWVTWHDGRYVPFTEYATNVK